MKKIFIIALLLILFDAYGTYAEEINEPETIHTESELEEMLLNGETVSFNDLYYAVNDGIAMFSSSYAKTELYYDQLTKYEKEFYDFYKENSYVFKDGTSSLTKEFKLPLSGVTNDNFETLLEEELGSDTTSLLTMPIYAYFYLDHPEDFWVDLNHVGFSYGNNGMITYDGTYAHFSFIISLRSDYSSYWPDCYTSAQQLESDIAAMDEKINEILAGLPENATDFYKVKYFTEWLCDNCSYNPSIKTGSRYMYIAPSAFLYGLSEDTTKRPVCEGYSEAFKILCNKADVKAMCTESSTHKWNIVYINDKFYYCDPTWCDGSISENYSKLKIAQYGYMLIGTDKMYELDTGSDHDISYQRDFVAPVISTAEYLEDMDLPIYTSVTLNGYSVSKGYFSYRYLDINNDGYINNTDLTTLLKQTSEINTLESHDINSDNKTNIGDVIRLMKVLYV